LEKKFEEFVEIVKRLRKECPWDRVQTFDSLKEATIEETYEVIESIDNKDFDELKIELGDLLLHVIFYSTMAEEEGHFNISDVIEGIREKLIRRHPHVFGNTEVDNADEVKKNWEQIKLKEGRKSVLEGVPVKLPALQRAYRLQEKASKVGFDWDKKEDVWAKVIEEASEMHEAEKLKNYDELEGEVGDLFFALINYTRFLKVNPENALRRSTEKFIRRFNYVQEKISSNGGEISKSTLEEMDKFWNEAKKNE
jgi:XTP/dITP diphosphohydrolase